MHYLDYNEKIQHKTNELPLAYYHIDKLHPRYSMPFHWHQEAELLYVSSGELHIYLDEKEYHLCSGDLIYISGGVLHGAEPTNCVYECVVFDFHALFMKTPGIRDYFYKIDHKKIVIHELLTGNPEIISSITDLLHVIRFQNVGWELFVLGKLLEIYTSIFQNELYTQSETQLKSKGKIQELKPVLEYIDANYSNIITLEELAHIAGMTPKYFCRFFHAMIHKTPVAYVNYYRIEKACYLLETTSLSITDVAYQCGFNDSSYFIRCFKKYKSTTPKQYLLSKRGL